MQGGTVLQHKEPSSVLTLIADKEESTDLEISHSDQRQFHRSSKSYKIKTMISHNKNPHKVFHFNKNPHMVYKDNLLRLVSTRNCD